jgi:hypothetical protein
VPQHAPTRGLRLLVVALAFTAAWLVLHPALPVPVNADLYTHLGVARHLVQGDGFLCDLAYPLSAAFPWGRDLPQPLLVRQPAFGVLLTVPYMLAGRDPATTVTSVHLMQALLLGLVVCIGMRALDSHLALTAAPAWLLLLLASPLLHLAASWGWTELAGGLGLLATWVRWRNRAVPARRRALLLDGSLAGAIAMLRIDLAWVPLLWWLVLGYGPAARRSSALPRAAVWLAIGWLLVTTPWFVRTARVAGSPFFTLQGQAIEVDLGERGWSYGLLRGLTPVTLADALRDQPAAAIKVRHGVRVFGETLGLWLPWGLWIVGASLGARQLWRRRRRGRTWFAAGGTTLTLGLTLALLVLQYALLSQEVRHLLVMLPVLSWELAVLSAATLRRARRLRAPLARAGAMLAVTGAALLLTPPGIGGEQAGLATAPAEATAAAALAQVASALPPGPVFTDNEAVLWLADRAGMWSPYDERVEAEIRARVPALREAPWLRLPTSTDQ